MQIDRSPIEISIIFPSLLRVIENFHIQFFPRYASLLNHLRIHSFDTIVDFAEKKFGLLSLGRELESGFFANPLFIV